MSANNIKNDKDWFVENTVPGCRYGNVKHGFKMSEVIHRQKTKFQECLIFDNPVYGRVLVLDEIVQFSTSDEHIYHEMLVQPPMFSHPNPKKVLVIGGGDGGVLREVLKHQPDEIVMIDIDEEFVRSMPKHLPDVSNGAFDNPKVKVIFEDANQALERFENEFDVAIIDCNDAIGPSAILFETPFYSKISRALKSDAVCAVQTGSILDADFIKQIRDRIEETIGTSQGVRLTIPSYHCGEYVFILAHKSKATETLTISELKSRQEVRNIPTSYWSPEMDAASRIFSPMLSLW